MIKKDELYRGKAKNVYKTENLNYLILEFRNDTSRLDGKEIKIFDRKGIINNKLNFFIMNKIQENGVPTHIIKLLSDNETLVKKLDMIPIEFVIRNYASGSLVKRLGIKEGFSLNPPILELFLKNDEMHDPMINESYCKTFNWVSKKNLVYMQDLTYKINTILRKIFLEANLILVDFKVEFGLLKGKVILGDEFSPDNARIWDKKTLNKMDKDRYRQSLTGLIEAYEEVAKRLGVKL